VVFFSLAHYAVLMVVAGSIFLASHVPPKAINLDPMINVFVWIEDVLVAPRRLLFRLWPSENTPRFLGLVLTVLNSVFWGVFLNTVKILRNRVR